MKIILRSDLAPSSLLHDEPVSDIVLELLAQSRSSRRNYKWELARQCAQDAFQFCQGTPDHLGSALAQLHLSDFYADVGAIQKAMEKSREAYRLLAQQAFDARRQQQNAAVAAYSLGLLNEMALFSDSTESLRWYQEALRLLEQAKQYWSTRKDKAQIDACQRISQKIHELRNQILQRRTSQPTWRVIFDIWVLGSKSVPFGEHTPRRHGYISQDAQVKVDGSFYYFHQGDLPKEDTGNQFYHFALPVPENGWPISDAQTDDYLFICQRWEESGEKEKLVWEPGNGWQRDEDGNVHLSPLPPAYIIGGDKLKGYVTALLKPTSAPSPPSPPLSSAPLPPPQTPVEPSERYDQLVNMVGGDRATANRLIEYEREQAPGADVAEWVERAITRLERDRR